MSDECTKELDKLLSRECPEYVRGTIVLTDVEGNVIGYGRIEKSAGGATVTILPPPAGCRLLAR